MSLTLLSSSLKLFEDNFICFASQKLRQFPFLEVGKLRHGSQKWLSTLWEGWKWISAISTSRRVGWPLNHTISFFRDFGLVFIYLLFFLFCPVSNWEHPDKNRKFWIQAAHLTSTYLWTIILGLGGCYYWGLCGGAGIQPQEYSFVWELTHLRL